MDITLPDLSRDADRGQVGIETLIIFIAMILVAAIAASVLINTAGYLQNQASATSEDSEAQVSNQVLVISSIGEISEIETVEQQVDVQFSVDSSDVGTLTLSSGSYDGDLLVETNGQQTTWNPSNGDLTDSEFSEFSTVASQDVTVTSQREGGADMDSNTFNVAASSSDTASDFLVDATYDNQIGKVDMTVMQSPGANEIDLGGASVEYIGPDGEATLSYSDTAGEGVFAVDGTTDPDNTAPVLTSREDRFTITAELVDDETSDLRNLKEGEEATIRIVTQSGSQAVTVVNVPQSLSSYDNGDAVEL